MRVFQDIQERTTAEVKEDEVSRVIYSIDASIFEVKPLGIVLPKSELDVIQIVKIAKSAKIPIIPRGSGTGITGGCLGEGIIVDTSKYMNKIVSIDAPNKTVTVEPGVIQDDLNKALFPLGLRLGPDTSTGDRATIGGMAANNAAGARSLFFGTMAEAVISVTMVLSTGEKITFSPLSKNDWKEKCELLGTEGIIYRTLEKIRNEGQKEIKKQFPKIPRRASGYNLDSLISKFPKNVSELIVGSEGTLGVITELTLKCHPILERTKLVLIPFDSMDKAMKAVPRLLKELPISLEMMDRKIMEAGKDSPSLKASLSFLKDIPEVLLVAEFQDTVPEDLGEVISDKETQNAVWALRKAGLGLLLSKRSYARAVAFIEDLSIPPRKLAPFMEKFLAYLEENGKQAGIYGHVGPGCLHIRPYMNLQNEDEVVLLKKMMKDVAEMVLEFDGALSGEHGDGYIRSWLNEKLFGKVVVSYFEEIKNAFDPENLMNPHKIVNPEPPEIHIRESAVKAPETFLSFEKEGGLALSVDLCNGNGLCLKSEGVMCPSYQATRDEYDSTRARATYLRNVIRGEKGLAEESLKDILDLCLQCKGCKKECPSQIDMAKMKSEALYQYQEKKGYSLRSRIFSNVDKLNKILFPVRGIYNFFLKNSLSKKILSTFGIATLHPLPFFSKKKFSELFQEIKQRPGEPLVLMNDTYTEFYSPEIGIAAVKVLNHIGFNVTLAPYKCCGRPAISKGFLKGAKNRANDLYETLLPYQLKKVPIIGLEPSCLLTLLDEYPSLLGKEALKVQLFDTFVSQHLPIKLSSKNPKKVALHGHCHQRALVGMQDTLKILHSIEGIEVEEAPEGCCGMAGSFGYEKEHSTLSQKIANLKLYPFLKKLKEKTFVIANGVSCRSQIVFGGKKPLHLAEFLQGALEEEKEERWNRRE